MVSLMTTYRISVKHKGRAVLPVGLQKACGFAPGDDLVARPLGEGRFIVESTNAIMERIWSQVPEGSPQDATESLEEWRAESTKGRRAEIESPVSGSTPESRRRGARLLAEFGL